MGETKGRYLSSGLRIMMRSVAFAECSGMRARRITVAGKPLVPTAADKSRRNAEQIGRNGRADPRRTANAPRSHGMPGVETVERAGRREHLGNVPSARSVYLAGKQRDILSW
jgi:hypothetical protein